MLYAQYLLYAQFALFVYVLYMNMYLLYMKMYLLYAQVEDIVSDFKAIVLYAQCLFYAQSKPT